MLFNMRPVHWFVIAAMLSTDCIGAEEHSFPVVVELFTSESCSSCPPADDVLEKLQSGAGNRGVIALEEHVDYWNNLGWSDRFSSPLFRARQTEYAQVFKEENIYTPQMVVNGRAAFVGTDLGRALEQINRAAAVPKYQLRLQPQWNNKDPQIADLTVMIKANRPGTPEPADVYLAISESHLSTRVLHGENGGRTLKHGPVVRSFGVIGNIEARQFNEVGVKSTLKIPSEWKIGNLRAVVFVQDHTSRQITAAVATDLR